ncbi:MAG: nucleotidyltransferase domain-containing protein [Chloroflexi bacterium]|nr:nucleotidyltransferase domain-containing protein [Chloroflexota bacterium]
MALYVTASSADPQIIQEIVRRIVQVSQPEKVILFGSRARGTARSMSDIDLLVIAHSTQPRHRRAAPLYGVLSDIIAPMDIVVYSPEEVQEWSEVRQAFVTTAIREGQVLYENPLQHQNPQPGIDPLCRGAAL